MQKEQAQPHLHQEERRHVIEAIIAQMRRHDITLDEIGGALKAQYGKDKSHGLLVRILAYIGAALVFGGLSLFIAMQWDAMPSAARVVITYGSGLAAFIMALVILKDAPQYRGAVTPLALASAGLMPAGMAVFLAEYTRGNDTELAGIVIFSILAAQFLIVFWSFRRTSLLFFGYLFFVSALALWMRRMGTPDELLTLVIGLSVLCVAWRVDASPYRAIAGFWYVIGGFGLLYATYDIMAGTILDPAMIAVPLLLIFFSVQIRSRALLTVNTLGLLALLGYYTDEYFSDIIGWPLALMLLGGLLIGISVWALKLGQKIKAG